MQKFVTYSLGSREPFGNHLMVGNPVTPYLSTMVCDRHSPPGTNTYITKWSQVQTPVKNLTSQIKDKTQHDTEYKVPSHQEVRTLKLTEEVELNYSHSPWISQADNIPK